MVPLRISSREVLIQSNHIHARMATDDVSGVVDGANPRSQLACPMSTHDPQEGVNHFGGGDKADSPQLGEGRVQLLPPICGPPLLAERTRTLGVPHFNMDAIGGRVRTLCPLHHLPHKQTPPCRWVSPSCVGTEGGGGLGSERGCRRLGRAGYHVARGPLQEKSKLHGHGKVQNSKKMPHISAIFR